MQENLQSINFSRTQIPVPTVPLRFENSLPHAQKTQNCFFFLLITAFMNLNTGNTADR